MTPPAVMELLSEQTRGEYDILWELGAGGMASVFAAHDRSLDRAVAIKVLSARPEIQSLPGIVERFLDEARTVARLQHPNIVTIHSVCSRRGLHYFVMEFVSGKTLKALLASQPEAAARSPGELVRIIGDVASALQYAHLHGVVHRDVKPANIMIDADGRTVVMDFGIARVTQETGLTQPGTILGTPAYMSPEQCAAAQETTGAADQYALGVVAYEMLAGRTPFCGADVQMMYEHIHLPHPPLVTLAPNCPSAIGSVIDRMLMKRPQERWPTIADAAAALQAAYRESSGTESAAAVMPVEGRSSPQGTKARRAVAASLGVLLTSGALLTARELRSRSGQSAASAAPPRMFEKSAITDAATSGSKHETNGDQARSVRPTAPADSVTAAARELRGRIVAARGLSSRGDYAAATRAFERLVQEAERLAAAAPSSATTDSLVSELVAARAENIRRCSSYAALVRRRGLPSPVCN